MVANDIKYFESGFLVVTTGATSGAVILGLQDISLSYEVETSEVLAFENNFNKITVPTFKGWSASCGGSFIGLSGTAGEGTHPSSGDTRVVGSNSGEQLLELVKQRRTDLKMIMKLGTSNYQVGNCILTSFEVSSSAGEPLTFSLEIAGAGELVKSST